MKFTPLKFQGSLAAAGMALMPYNYMKSTFYEGYSTYNLYTLSKLSLNTGDFIAATLLIILLFSFIVIHLLLTVSFAKELVIWLTKTNELRTLMKNPLSNTTVFSPLISLPMTMIVLIGPASFFIPQITANVQSIMLPALMIFVVLWVSLLSLEFIVVKNLFIMEFEYKKLNFAWLLDVLAFGAVSLFGSSIVATSNDSTIASLALIMTIISLSIGVILFVSKFILLVSQQVTSKQLPEVKLLPAFFLVIPPNCLLWFSFHKLLAYGNKMFSFDTSVLSFIVIVLAYVATISWLVFLAVLLKDYFKTKFIGSEFSPAQWGIV